MNEICQKLFSKVEIPDCITDKDKYIDFMISKVTKEFFATQIFNYQIIVDAYNFCCANETYYINVEKVKRLFEKDNFDVAQLGKA